MTTITLNSESVMAEGEVTILVTPSGCDESFVIFRDCNRIMDVSKAYVLSSIYNPSFVPDVVSTFKVGTGGTATIGGSDPKPVSGGMSDLYTPITPAGNYNETLPTPAVSLDGKTVTYSFSIADTELVGTDINEVAMFRQSGTIFNVKTFPSIAKTGGFSLTFLWTIRYK